ncbi:MAG: hypothetical protein K0U47_01105 [Epsilonproteobacteria bacterium]|nr:hypothetical protein [Campylobacterota bacterium]
MKQLNTIAVAIVYFLLKINKKITIYLHNLYHDLLTKEIDKINKKVY